MQVSSFSSKNSNYPALLSEITHPPKELFCLGQVPKGIFVAIVGTRKPTSYGRQVTFQLAGELAKAGIVIVSGLALGVDAIAHEAAIEAGGLTVAVQANGLDQIYPTANRRLAQRILDHGAIISEYPIGTRPFKQHFPARNRIIAGLSVATIVTEAEAKSGSLITANFALNENRLVMAVPGNITSPTSAGPNNLIKSGALAITSASDVLAALDLEQASTVPVKADSREEAMVLELLAQGLNSSQELIEHSGLSASQFANIISLMEITGKVRNLGAGQWVSR